MLQTAIIFFIILSILIFVHEFGHYIVARLFGVHVEEFGFGLPPRLWGKKIKGTIYSLNWLPIGGFVRLAGEDADETDIKSVKADNSKKKIDTYFWAKSKTARSLILLAGVFMNTLLAVGITTVLLTRGVIEPTGVVRVEQVTPGSPAEDVGVLVNDRISSVTSTDEKGETKVVIVTVPSDVITFMNEKKGKTVSITLMRAGQEIILTTTPRANPPEGQGPLGVTITDLEKHVYSWREAPVKAVKINAQRVWQMLTGLGSVIGRLVTGGKIAEGEVAGPIGIAQVTGEAVKYGFDAVLEFMSILSLNLALLNVLPFPALDGGRLAFVVLEKMGRKARPQLERTIHQIGMLFLLGLMALISLQDILRIFHR